MVPSPAAFARSRNNSTAVESNVLACVRELAGERGEIGRIREMALLDQAEPAHDVVVAGARSPGQPIP
jgi:L-fucose mutarotase/ribose pyranase (RbsD/FucU family)